MLHSKIRRRKKQRVAASADLASEVPNLGVARALFLILILHVAAIAAIFIHNRVTDDEVVVRGSESQKAASAVPGVEPTAASAKGGESFYFVSTGDTYERIARLKGVDVKDLRDLNKRKGLDPGAILRIPTNRIVPSVEVASAAPDPLPDAPESPAVPVNQVSAVVKPSVTQREADGTSSLRVQTKDPPRAIPVSENGPLDRVYAVKSGDTVWRIAQQHDVSVQKLLEANGIDDARKLQVNMKLRIPAR